MCLRDEIDSFTLFNKSTIRKPLRMLGPYISLSSCPQPQKKQQTWSFVPSRVSKKKELNILSDIGLQ